MTYRAEIEAAAAAQGIDPDVVAALVEQESSGKFYAYRFEPAFWERYLKGKAEYAQWAPAECSASYGLCQVMFSTAREHGFTGQPWELFAPAVSLEYGCRVLKRLLLWAQSHYTGLAANERRVVMRSALAAYNGGKTGNAPTGPIRNAEYADAVLSRYERIKAVRT